MKYVLIKIDNAWVSVNDEALPEADAQAIYDDLKTKLATDATIDLTKSYGSSYDITVRVATISAIQIGETAHYFF